MTAIVRRRDLDFILYEMLATHELCAAPRYADHSRDVFDQVIDAAHRLALDLFEPYAALTDREEPVFEAGKVKLIPQTETALNAFVEAGMLAAAFDADLGGMQLPYTIAQAIGAIFGSANGSVSGYPMLSAAAANLICTHGSEEQIERYARPLIAGRFFGTMCLSEPQAGSSLADIRTRAEPAADGSFRLFGNKMWISGGEHDMGENIIQLVLAKIPGGPAGVKGISLFIVPKFVLNEDGSSGARNDITLAGINHKMGNRGTVNTILNFGDNDGAVGYLVGQPGNGLACMFHMMNEARIAVGLGASATAYAGYLHALAYAKERRQGRPLSGRDPSSPMVPIIQHADVKRMLLQQKAYAEGSLALCLYCAALVDKRRIAQDAGDKAGDGEYARLGLLLDILTPIAKSWPSEYGVRANDQAIQVHGGYGYTREYDVERLYRDNRLNPIHEGTKGIQGLDLLGRKVSMDNGAAVTALAAELAATIAQAGKYSELSEFAVQLDQASASMIATTQKMYADTAGTDPERLLANATLYLDAFGHVVVAWQWLAQATSACAGLSNNPSDGAFYRGKIAACQYFFRYELPQIAPTLALLGSLDDTCLAMADDAF